jgi:hypothetical protein
MDAQTGAENDMIDLIEQMEIIRRRIRSRLVIRSIALIVSMAITWILISILVDSTVRLPSIFRLMVLLLGVFLLFRFMNRHLIPSIKFNPPLVEIALRIETCIPIFKSRLATAVEFSSNKEASQNQLAMKSIKDVCISMEKSHSDLSGVIRSKPVITALSLAILVSSIFICGFIFWNSFTITGLNRALLPLGSTAWPATTAVEGLHDPYSVHPRGTPFMLRSHLTTGDPDITRITALVDSVDGSDPTRSVVLTPQENGDFERLINLDGEGVQVVFKTHDSESSPIVIHLVDPPAIESTTLKVTPPEYASSVIEDFELDLGTGSDTRSSPDTPFLEGSMATFEFNLNKQIPVPDPTDSEWLETTFGRLGDDSRFFEKKSDMPVWVLEKKLDTRIGSIFTLVDEHGILNSDEIAFTIDVVEDRLPVTLMLEPDADEQVLLGAVIPLRSESRDDILIESSRMIIRKKSEEVNDHDSDMELVSSEFGNTITIRHDLHVSGLDPNVGDVIEILSITRDVHSSGMDRPEITSSVRRLSIIDETEFITNIQSQIYSVRRNAIRLDELQEDNQKRLSSDVGDVAPEQARITQRISGTDEALREIKTRLQRNNLNDSFTLEVIEQSRDLLNMAGRASSSAQDGIESLESVPGEEISDQDFSNISKNQREVRDELADLISLLDRNQDDWVVSRQLSNMIVSMQDLNKKTVGLGNELIGKSTEDLTEEQTDSIDELADEQMGIVDKARDLSESLSEKSELMSSSESLRAEALQNAADRAQRSELSEKIEQSSRRISENQMERAADLQDQAIATLQEMMNDLDQNPASKAEELARLLSDLVESIERLVDSNEQLLIDLARLPEVVDAILESGVLDFFENMAFLTRNTSDVARDAGPDASGGQRINRRLLDAASSQEAVMIRLRDRPIEDEIIRSRLKESLGFLREALDLARSARDSAQRKADERKKDEIRSIYLDLAEVQAGIYLQSSDLLGLVQGEPTRRQTMQMRRLSVDQESIRIRLEELLEEHPDLKKSLLVSGIHSMVDEWSTNISGQLSVGVIDDRVVDRESMIMDSILNLASALQNDPTDEKTFDQNEDKAAGGAQGG